MTKTTTAPKTRTPKHEPKSVATAPPAPKTAPVVEQVTPTAKKDIPTAPAKVVKLPASKPLTRKELLKLIYAREFTPLNFDEIKRVVAPGYEALFQKARAQQSNPDASPIVIQVLADYAFLIAYMRSNGANRSRKWNHVERLALEAFRGIGPDGKPNGAGFDPSCTHFVVTRNGAVANGGHSAPAMILAFYHVEDIHQDMFSGVSTGFEWIGKDDTSWLPDKLLVTLVLNAPPESVLKMDDVRLKASGSDYIEMLPCLQKFIEDYAVSSKELDTWCAGMHKRTEDPIDIKDPKTGKQRRKFGSVAVGGRLNATESPVRVISFAPMIIESLRILRSHGGNKDIRFHNGLNPNAGNGLGLKDVLVAMAVLANNDQRERLAKAICKQSTIGEALATRLTRPVKSSGWSKPNADWIISFLVAVGLGKRVNPIADMPDSFTDDKSQDETYRAASWDRGSTDESGQLRQTVYTDVGNEVAKMIGDPDLVKSIALKETRRTGAAKKAAKAKA